VLLKTCYSSSYLACPQAAESEGERQVSRQCATGSSYFNSNTHTHHTMQAICCSFSAFYLTEVADPFLQHITVSFCNTVQLTHSCYHLKQLNSCDSNKAIQYMSASEEAFLYKLKPSNVHCLKICRFSCTVDISSPAQACFMALLILCKSKTWCQFSPCYSCLAM
jgi:hypothetical protein